MSTPDSSRRALVIDDSRAMRAILRRIMTELGFEVVEASNGKEALDRLGGLSVSVALVDWNMPEMNGFEFVCKVRAQHEYDDVRLMMVTTETEMDHVAQALDAGANEYLMKPFTGDMVRAKLSLMGVDAS